MNSLLDEYCKSEFYKKYKGTYFSDSVLKNVLGESISKHRIVLDGYQNAYNKLKLPIRILHCNPYKFGGFTP